MGKITRKGFICMAAVMAMAPVGYAQAQEKSMEAGSPVTTRQKVELALVEACAKVADESVDEAERDRYQQLAMNVYAHPKAAYEVATAPAEFAYAEGRLLQLEGQGIGVRVSRARTAEERDKLAKQAEEKLDAAIALFKQVQLMARTEETSLPKDADRKGVRYQELREVRTKDALELCRTLRMKGLIYPEGSAERTSRLVEAIRIFDKYVDAFEADVIVLEAKYERGLCYRDIKKDEGALEDWQDIVTMGAMVVPEIPAVSRLRWKCAVEISSVLRAQGKADEAEKILKEVKRPKDAAEEAKELKAAINEAQKLLAKGDELKKAGLPGSDKSYEDALATLRRVIFEGGPFPSNESHPGGRPG